MEPELCQTLRQANTARHALELLALARRLDLVDLVGRQLLMAMAQLVGPGPGLWAMILDYEGQVLFQDHKRNP